MGVDNCYVLPDGSCQSPWPCVHGAALPWLQIDLNARSDTGFVQARAHRASRRLRAGEMVWVYEPDDQVMAPAEVVFAGTDFVHVAVLWDQMVPDTYGFSMPDGRIDVDKICIDLLSDEVEDA